MTKEILQQIAAQYKTPSYVFDTDLFEKRITEVRMQLGGKVKICYAMKANPFFTTPAASAADGFEVCSPGEYAICVRSGIAPEKIVLSGVNKEADEIEAVMQQNGAGTYTAESFNQVALLEDCAARAGLSHVPTLLRVTSGNQFGMDVNTIFSILSNIDRYPHLDFKGLQYYSGTQKKKFSKIAEELRFLDQLCTRLLDELQFTVRELEYGPGFYIPYFQGEEDVDEEALLHAFKEELASLSFDGTIILEMGRFLAAPCGCYLTRIMDMKNNQGQNYCIIDGGMNHINYYGQMMAMKLPPILHISEHSDWNKLEPEEEKWTICGSLCTAGDILAKNLTLSHAKIGDLLMFQRIGAYSVTEGIYLFLSRKLPAVILYNVQDGAALVRKAMPTDCFNS